MSRRSAVRMNRRRKRKALFPPMCFSAGPHRPSKFREQTALQLRNYGIPGDSSLGTFGGAPTRVLPDRYRIVASLVTVGNVHIILVVGDRAHCKPASGNYIQEPCTQSRGGCIGCSSYACPPGENVRKHRLDASIGGHEDWISWWEPSINLFSEQKSDLRGQRT